MRCGTRQSHQASAKETHAITVAAAGPKDRRICTTSSKTTIQRIFNTQKTLTCSRTFWTLSTKNMAEVQSICGSPDTLMSTDRMTTGATRRFQRHGGVSASCRSRHSRNITPDPTRSADLLTFTDGSSTVAADVYLHDDSFKRNSVGWYKPITPNPSRCVT